MEGIHILTHALEMINDSRERVFAAVSEREGRKGPVHKSDSIPESYNDGPHFQLLKTCAEGYGATLNLTPVTEGPMPSLFVMFFLVCDRFRKSATFVLLIF